ncbi:MAG: immune inhibitor A [Anaerolineales bacterium]|nr:immune inhibitor A [Anaerolineales bacterium]
MTNRKRMITGSLLLGMLAVAVLVTTAAVASGTEQSSPAPAGLSSERAAEYDSLLLSLQRDAPYMMVPREDYVYGQVQLELGPGATKEEIQAGVDAFYEEFNLRNNKHSRPNPMAYLGRLKARERAEAAGKTDIEAASALTGTPQVLTVMVNFTGTTTYDTGAGGDPILYNGVCLTDTVAYPVPGTIQFDGPSFNEVPDPALSGDNWTGWIPPASYTGGYSQAYYEEFMYGTTGYTKPWRTDLTNPWDSGSGFDFSGVTFKNYYLEQSRGVYDPGGGVEEISLPVSEAYYGADTCDGGFNNYNGPIYNMASDSADMLNADYPGASTGTNPDFSWASWDQEDVFDYDNDGNYFEPDGYVDHYFIIEAGIGEHGGGGFLQELAIWAHSSDISPGNGMGPPGNELGGHQVATDASHPLGEVWVLNYTISDEASGLGVLVHEYGHDIGLPDNYAYDGSGPNPGLWDLMASGSWNGELAGMRPSHMTIWDKEFLGWNSPVDLDLNSADGVYSLGQQSIPPAGTVDGLRISLPDIEKIASVTPYGTMMWYSDLGDDRSESIANSFTPAAGEVVTVSTQMAYDIELDWDYLYVEISSTTTGGWVPLKVYSGTTEITTDTDPNGNNSNGNGITGLSPGWITASTVITDGMHGDATFDLRFRYLTDAAVQNEGIYLDNISVDGSVSGNIFFDDVEGGDLWTHMSNGVNTTAPWYITDGVSSVTQYYLAEWRNSGEPSGANGNGDTASAFATAGYDLGLNRSYWVSNVNAAGDIVRDPFFMHTPGLLVWYVNNTYDDNAVGAHLFDGPSWGSKGRVLLADANPLPYYVDDITGSRSVGERRSAFDGAYSLTDRPGLTLTSNLGSPYLTDTVNLSTTTITGAPAVPGFHDRIGVYPGISSFTFVDYDAGVVLPVDNGASYWPAWDDFGDTGNPGVNAFGVNLDILGQASDGTYGVVKFYVDKDTVFVTKQASSDAPGVGDVVTYTVTLKDASGSRYSDSHLYTFTAALTDTFPAGMSYISGTLSVVDGPQSVASTASVVGNQVLWNGWIGGNPLHIPDATIQYQVMVDDLPACLADFSYLSVVQDMITDDFANGGAPFLWPQHDSYKESLTACRYFPLVSKSGP